MTKESNLTTIQLIRKVKKYPDNLDLHFQLGKKLASSWYPDMDSLFDAIVYLEYILEKNSDFPAPVNLYRGYACIKLGKFNDLTTRILQDASSKEPDNYLSHLLLGINYAELQSDEKAAKEINTALSLDQDSTILELIQLKRQFFRPLSFLSVLEKILQKVKPDEELYDSVLVVFDNWKEYDRCVSLCEKRLNLLHSKKHKKLQNFANHNLHFYKGIVSLKDRKYTEAEEYFKQAASYLKKLRLGKDNEFYKTHSIIITLFPDIINLNKLFEKVINSSSLYELRQNTKSIIDYFLETSFCGHLESGKATGFFTMTIKYHLDWQYTISYTMFSALEFLPFEFGKLSELAHNALERRNLNQKKIVNACENFILLLSQYRDFDEARRNEESLLKELSLVSNLDMNIFDMFQQIRSDFRQTHKKIDALTNEELKTREEIKKAVQEPVRSDYYKTNYLVTIARDSGVKGILTIDTGRKYIISLTKTQFQLMQPLAQKSKTDKDLPPKNQGWMNYEEIKEAVDSWNETTSDAQVRTQVNQIRAKLGKKCLDKYLLENQEGTGYRISTHPENITVD